MTQPDPQTATLLNAVLKHKLTSINQYFLHARMLKHAGELTLADHTYRASIGAMKMSDMLVEHLLQLGGKPEMQALGEVAIGKDRQEMLENDVKNGQASLALIHAAMQYCQQAGQTASVELLKRLAENQQDYLQSLQALLQPMLKDCA